MIGVKLGELLKAKAMSDRGEYDRKLVIMRRLIAERPDEFEVDSSDGRIAGVTHVPTGFRMHLPLRAVKNAFVESPSVSFRGPTIGRSLGVGLLGAAPGALVGMLAGSGIESALHATGHQDLARSKAMSLIGTLLRAAGTAGGGMLAQSYDNQFDHRYWDHEGNKLKRPKKDEKLEAEEKQAVVRQVGDKWVLFTKDMKRRLGTHDTAREAYIQEYAIQKSQERDEVGAGVEKAALDLSRLVRFTRAGAGVAPGKRFFGSPLSAAKHLGTLGFVPRYPGRLGSVINFLTRANMASALYGAGRAAYGTWENVNDKLDGVVNSLPLQDSVKSRLDDRGSRFFALPKLLADAWVGSNFILPASTPEPVRGVIRDASRDAVANTTRDALHEAGSFNPRSPSTWLGAVSAPMQRPALWVADKLMGSPETRLGGFYDNMRRIGSLAGGMAR